MLSKSNIAWIYANYFKKVNLEKLKNYLIFLKWFAKNCSISSSMKMSYVLWIESAWLICYIKGNTPDVS